MALQKVMLGPFGPFIYDDSKVIADTEFSGANYAGVITTGAIKGETIGSSDGYSGTVTVTYDIRDNLGAVEYRTIALTFTDGVLTSVGSPSAWTAI